MKIGIHFKVPTPLLTLDEFISVTCYDGENTIELTAENFDKFRVKTNTDYVFRTAKLQIAVNSDAILYVVFEK